MAQLNEVLSRALSQSENQDTKKLLSYLKEKVLVDWKPLFHASKQRPEDVTKVEKQIESDLNYLNVFV